MKQTHLMDLPAPVSDIRLNCGIPMAEARRGDTVTHNPAFATCIACLRTECAKLLASHDARNSDLEMAQRELKELQQKVRNTQPEDLKK